MSTLRYSFQGLKQLQRKLEELDKRHVKVGLLSSTAQRVPTKSDRIAHNPSLGAIHEFGLTFSMPGTGQVITIPQRSFIRMPLTQHLGDTVNQNDTNWIELLMGRGPYRVLERLGTLGRNTIQTAFDTKGWGQWPDLSKFTIWKKKRNKTRVLIETQQLRQAITSQVV